MSNSKQEAHPEQVGVEVRRGQALELRLGGANYRQIAASLGINVSTAHRYVTEGLGELRAENDELTEEVRRVEVARLDSMLLSLWPKRKEPRTADTILRVAERRAKLLGLDAAIKWEGSGPGGAPIPISGDFDLTLLPVALLQDLERVMGAIDEAKRTLMISAGTAPLEVPRGTNEPTDAVNPPSEGAFQNLAISPILKSPTSGADPASPAAGSPPPSGDPDAAH